MNLKAVVIVGAIVVVVLALLLVFTPAPEKDESPQLYTYSQNTDTTEIMVEYPYFGYEKADEKLKEIVENFVGGFEEAVREIGPLPNGRPYVLVVEDEITTETEDTVGITLLVYQDFGGAHGLPQFIGLNFYKETGEEVTLSDVLTRIDRTLENLAQETDVYFTQKIGEGYFSEGTEPVEENYQSFLIGESEITFYFQPYQVAAYALGIQEYKISY